MAPSAALQGRRRLDIALAIGAATVPSGSRAVLWKPLPFADADRPVFVSEVTGPTATPARVTGGRYTDWRRTSGDVFVPGVLWFDRLHDRRPPRPHDGARRPRVPGYFATLGVEPVLGRVFAEGDDVPSMDRVVVLSHGFWLERLGGRPEAVGTTLRLGDEPYTIIGVMPPVTFPGWPVNPATVTLDPEARQLWVPLADTAGVRENSRSHLYGVVARLRDGVTPAHAADVLSRATDPAAADPHQAHVTPLRDQFVRGPRTPLLLLATASIAVLLLACANLTALYYSAYERRQRELSVRAAVGAGRMRLARQLLAEAAVPTAAGGLRGCCSAPPGSRRCPRCSRPVPLLTTPRLDAAGLLFGLAAAGPARRALRVDPVEALRAE